MEVTQTGIVLIDAPTGSGKTRYIKELGATPSNTLTSEQLKDHLLQMCRTKSSLDETAAKLRCIAHFENMESLSGQPESQKLAAQLIKIMAKERRIILTGIDLRKKLPFFLDALEACQADPMWSSRLITARETEI